MELPASLGLPHIPAPSGQPDLLIEGIGDPHFKDSNGSETDLLHQDCVRYANQWKPRLIICFGDLIHTFEKTKMRTHRRANQFLQDLSKEAHTILLLGNHDRPINKDYNSEDHFYTGVARPGVLEIIDRPTGLVIDGLRLLFIPYFVGTIDAFLAEYQIDPTQFDYAFGHMETYGADIRPSERYGPLPSKGDRWPSHYPPLISGHIHKRQHLENVYYIGTPYQETFAEDTAKGIAQIRLSRPSSRPNITYFSTSIPMKLTVELTVLEFYAFVPTEGVLTKLVIRGSPEEVATLRKTPQYKAALKRFTVDLKDFPVVPTRPDVVGFIPLPEPMERPDFWKYVHGKLNDRQQQRLSSLQGMRQ